MSDCRLQNYIGLGISVLYMSFITVIIRPLFYYGQASYYSIEGFLYLLGEFYHCCSNKGDVLLFYE